MPYATPADLIDLMGEDALSAIADRDGDFVADEAVIVKAIESADAEIDLYLGVRYSLPLPSVPHALMQISRDIAVYRLGLAGGATEEHRVRYEDTLKLLQRIADGKASLSFPPGDDDTGDEEEGGRDSGPRPIVTSGPPRLFTRERMRDL